MLNRIKIDNYKSFLQFDFSPNRFQPIFGTNGTGKSNFFSFLYNLRKLLVDGISLENTFPTQSTNRWMKLSRSVYLFDLLIDDVQFSYGLYLDFDLPRNSSNIYIENLSVRHNDLVKNLKGVMNLSTIDPSLELEIKIDRSYSGLNYIEKYGISESLSRFSETLRLLQHVSLHPCQMTSRSEASTSELNPLGDNFSSWLRHATQEDMSLAARIIDDLREVIPGFDSFALVREGGDVRMLKVDMKVDGQKTPTRFDFSELSDGQRVLFALYSILHGMAHPDAILCFDEPMNFVALAEIQPFLVRLTDMVDEGKIGQVFIATHNSETIDYLTLKDAALFVRDDSGAIRVKSFADLTPGGLRASEIMARGWEEAK